ncbi:MerR family transcriptional regulator [Streptomyces corynorhini]|uniref:DNA-binding protein n=1 Tax=Streptomyces corynorhini TaxID=2282652 RepID=A0A370B1Y7_9ACTN|nr:DNA-binding protein [Streptomyces corynorhini]RDG34672.1 DNA-binding protein [Streptomyces corynorhini]
MSADDALPPLRDDVLYTAEETAPYVRRTPIWLKRAARADEIPAIKSGRFWRWNAQQIRQLIAGEPHVPQRRRRSRRAS